MLLDEFEMRAVAEVNDAEWRIRVNIRALKIRTMHLDEAGKAAARVTALREWKEDRGIRVDPVVGWSR